MVTMPALSDHQKTIKSMERKRTDAADDIEDAQQLVVAGTKSYAAAAGLIHGKLNLKAWERALDAASKYDIRLGHVYATSGLDNSKQAYNGILDWGIFHTPYTNVQNKVRY